MFGSVASGTSIYDPYLVMVYNVVFTSLPILFFGYYDYDLDV